MHEKKKNSATREIFCCSGTTIAEFFLLTLQYMELVTLDNRQCEGFFFVELELD